jgi:hypothetical protein
MMLALRTVPVAAGVIDAVVFVTALALIEAVAVVSAAAVLHGAEGLLVRERQIGKALQVCFSKGAHDIGDGGHGRSPCIKALMRW